MLLKPFIPRESMQAQASHWRHPCPRHVIRIRRSVAPAAVRCAASGDSQPDRQFAVDRRGAMIALATSCLATCSPANAIQGLTAGRIPGVTGPGEDGYYTYTRPEGKSGELDERRAARNSVNLCCFLHCRFTCCCAGPVTIWPRALFSPLSSYRRARRGLVRNPAVLL